MTPSIVDIRSRITSTDVNVLRQSLAFATARLADERDRGKTAETRAAATLAVLGVIAGLTVPQAVTLGAISSSGDWLLLTSYGAPLLFLARGIVYAVRVLSVSTRFRCTPELLFSFQDCSQQEALRLEIATVVWEHKEVVGPTNAKLYWLDRSQRNGLLALLFLAAFAATVLAVRQQWFEVPAWAPLAFGVLAAAAFFGESLATRQGIWRGD